MQLLSSKRLTSPHSVKTSSNLAIPVETFLGALPLNRLQAACVRNFELLEKAISPIQYQLLKFTAQIFRR